MSDLTNPAGSNDAVLKGIRVLDFGKFVAGPWCAALLADLGADVIHIEPVGGGEDRFIMPIREGVGAMFAMVNRSKRAMTLNPTKPAGREVLSRLMRDCDVIVVNMPPSSRASMGLAWEDVQAANPRAILVSITAYGEGGPYSDRLGFDSSAQVMSGSSYLSGSPGQPVKSLAPWADYATGYALAFATMTALYSRQTTGVGQLVEGALLRTALTMFGRELMEQAVIDANRVPTLNEGQTSGPSDIFPTTDGHVLIAVVGERQFKRWAELMGDEERWLNDPRFVDDASRGINRQPLCERLAQWCAERSTAEAVDQLNAAAIPAGPVYKPADTLLDPHIKAMGFLVPVEYPGVDRPAPTADFPVSLSATPGRIRFRAPLVSEHTESILADLGYSDAEIDDLRQQRIV